MRFPSSNLDRIRYLNLIVAFFTEIELQSWPKNQASKFSASAATIAVYLQNWIW